MWQRTIYTSSRSRHKLRLPSWTPEVGTDHRHCHHQGSCEQVQVTVSKFPGASIAHHCQGSYNLGPTLLGGHMAHCHCQRPYHPVPSNAPTSLAACNPLPQLPRVPQPRANFPVGVQHTATTEEWPETSQPLPGILCKPCTCAPAQPLARQ